MSSPEDMRVRALACSYICYTCNVRILHFHVYLSMMAVKCSYVNVNG